MSRCRPAISPFIPHTPGPPGPVYDPDAAIFFGADDFGTEFYTDEVAKQQVNDLVTMKKDIGTWEDTLWIFPNVGGTEALISRSLKNPTRFQKIYPNGATFSYLGDNFNGTNQYARCGCYPSRQMNSYSFCHQYFVKEATIGADDYQPIGLDPGIVIDHFATNRLFVVLGLRNAPANVWVLNPAPFGKLMAINYHSFDTVDYWQDGVKIDSQINDVRYYFPPIDPTDATADLYISAHNNNGTPINFAPWTYFYHALGHAMEDSNLIAEDDFLKNTFCPALFKIPD